MADPFENPVTNAAISALAAPLATAAVYPFVYCLLALRLRGLYAEYGAQRYFRYVASVSVTRSFMFLAVLLSGSFVGLFTSMIIYHGFNKAFAHLGPDVGGWSFLTMLILAPLGVAIVWLWRHQDAQAPGFGGSGRTSWLVRKIVYNEKGFF